jgi:uncharacterized protein YfaA (DUF2138 family)
MTKIRARSVAGAIRKMVLSGLLFTTAISGSALAANFDRQPDVIINSAGLSELPKDVLAVPLLSDLLTEDFVFYYRESGAHWMSFRGALARIAFEHQMDWPTRLMSWIMNGPAEVAVWKGDDGKLSHFMLVIDQTGVKELAALVARTVASDSQLKEDSSLGAGVHVLTLPTGRKVYFASEEGRFFVYSDPEMKIPREAALRGGVERAKAFFGANSDIAVFGPKRGKAKHLVIASVQYLSLGYQAFFDSLRAVRFEFQQEGAWDTQVLTTAAGLVGDPASWSLLPKGAALCVNTAIDKEKVGQIIHSERLLKAAAAHAIACWYPESKLYTPVFAVPGEFAEVLKKPEDLKAVFAQTVGVRGAVWQTKGESKPAADTPPELAYLPMLPVVSVKGKPGQVAFTREIGGRYGIYASKQSKTPERLGSSRFFRVKLIATPKAIIFSPDDRLADRAMDTLSGRFPSMTSSLPSSLLSGASAPSLVLAPDSISKLAKSSILESLPESQEAVFRSAVSRHFFPNLERFAKRPLVAGSIAKGEGWRSVEWLNNAAR